MFLIWKIVIKQSEKMLNRYLELWDHNIHAIRFQEKKKKSEAKRVFEEIMLEMPYILVIDTNLQI